MSDLRITNCHVHTFTAAHAPRDYPSPWLRPFKLWPRTLKWIAAGLQLIGQEQLSQAVRRLYRFQTEAARQTQAEVLDRLIPQYPRGTRFVLLPMDMTQSGHGPVATSTRAQQEELYKLRADPRFGGTVIPFATLDPRREGAAEEAVDFLKNRGFGGLKLYPRLGFAPDHPVLMKTVYPVLLERKLPVMTHCSRGGVTGKGLDRTEADRLSSPQAWKAVWAEYPELRVCLAHFGGMADWRDYVEHGIDPRDPDARAQNWQVAIREMITSGDWPGLWTDISYTLFEFENFVPFLKVFLADDRIAARVLFGSDFYMTRQEALSERAVCFRLRVALGDEMFRRIAQENPARWLGELV